LGVNLVVLFDEKVRYLKKVKNHCTNFMYNMNKKIERNGISTEVKALQTLWDNLEFHIQSEMKNMETFFTFFVHFYDISSSTQFIFSFRFLNLSL